MTWSLRRRLARFLAAIAVVVLAVVVVAIVLLVQVRSQQRQVISRYFTALSLSNQRFVAQIDAETAQRGYALTADRVTLQPAEALASQDYRQQLSRIQSLLRGDTATEAALASWEEASHTWYSESAAPTIVQVASGRRLTTAQVLAGKALFDKNRAAYATYNKDLVSRRSAANDSLKLRTTLLFIVVLVAVVALAAGGALIWLFLRRWVLRPLVDIGSETRLVTSGELNHAVVVDGPEEIVSLAADVDAMRQDIVAQLAEVEQARKQIEAARIAIEAQAEDLARSNRDLEQFAYVASHDLQEPLRKVASFCQMLDRRYSGQLDERADQYIAFAVDGAKRMQQLINDLLAFSRVGRGSAGFAEVDLQACLDIARQNLAGAIEASGATITADALPRLPGERGLLIQLLQNLIGNGLKFHGDATPIVHIGVVERDGSYEFSCADNGIGIEAQYAERIFVIFQRLHAKDEYGGTGIGLALCKRIVEHHGGQIWLDTDTPKGTVFRWTLPATSPDMLVAASTVDDGSISG